MDASPSIQMEYMLHALSRLRSMEMTSTKVVGCAFILPMQGYKSHLAPPGTLTIHPRQQLHGVTRLISGKRYSLFVVDRANGLGDKGVFRVDKSIFDVLKPLENE